MALSQSSLATDLKAVFDALPATAADAAAALAAAYHSYAGAGRFGTSAPTLSAARRDAMATTLLGAIATPATAVPAGLAGAWATALSAYWNAAPVTGAQTGTTAPPIGSAGIVAPLTTLFANTANTSQTCANSLAASLHTATTGVSATVTPPAGTVINIA